MDHFEKVHCNLRKNSIVKKVKEMILVLYYVHIDQNINDYKD